jgi:hypothetical protein
MANFELIRSNCELIRLITRHSALGTMPSLLRGTFAVHDLRRELPYFTEVDEIERNRVLKRQALEIGQDALDDWQLDPTEERIGRFIANALALIEPDQAFQRVWEAPRGYLCRETSELRAAVVDSTAYHDEVLRDSPGSQPPDAALKPDRRDVMLTAPIRAATDLDVGAISSRHELRMASQMLLEHPAEPSRLGDGQAA